MSTTLVLRNTMNFAAPFLKNQPLEVSNMEPAVTVANIVLGAMLGPPFRWRQNRREISFAIGSQYESAITALSVISDSGVYEIFVHVVSTAGLSIGNTVTLGGITNKPYLNGVSFTAVSLLNDGTPYIFGVITGEQAQYTPFTREADTGTVTTGSGLLTDYLQAVANFGFIEVAWLVDGEGNQHPLSGALALTANPDVKRPEKIAPQFDDNAGNITFRFDAVADQAYTCYVDFQGTAPLLTSPASGWGPVPDYFNYIFNFGFLAVMSLLVNDARFPIFEKYFMGRLLGAQSGLSEQERNIFLANWALAIGTMKKADMMAGAGIGGS
jgi:hypothetical protein